MGKIYQKMYPENKSRSKDVLGGFTLIEILVVVLIVGILAAIALPQYEKAVEKSRAAEGVVLARSIFLANERYLMATGRYATDIDSLDLQFPGEDIVASNGVHSKKTAHFQCRATPSVVADSTKGITAVCRRIKNGVSSYYISYTGGRDQAYCKYNNAEDKKWCQILSGREEEPFPL